MIPNETYFEFSNSVYKSSLFFLKLKPFENETATHVEGYVMCKMKSHEREPAQKMET